MPFFLCLYTRVYPFLTCVVHKCLGTYLIIILSRDQVAPPFYPFFTNLTCLSFSQAGTKFQYVSLISALENPIEFNT
jgi:hypothetical protein